MYNFQLHVRASLKKIYLSTVGVNSFLQASPSFRQLFTSHERQGLYPNDCSHFCTKRILWKLQLYLTYLNLGGSIGSFCISTMRMTLCLAPELKANPCWEGVYLMYCAAWGFCATWVGCAAAILVVTSFSNASLVFLVVYNYTDGKTTHY